MVFAEKPALQAVWEEPNEDELRLLNVYLEKIDLNAIITAYQVKGNLLLPLAGISELVDLAIKTYPEKGIAEGFILKENRQLFLDTSRHEITLLGKTKSYPKDLVVIYPDDIYVESNELMTWLPFTTDINLFASSIRILPNEPFPITLRLEREKRMAKVRSRYIPEKQNYPLKKLDYQVLSYPFIDQTINFSAATQNGKEDTQNFQYITHAAADILYMETSLYLTGNINSHDSVNDYRVTFGRKDPESGLLGPLHASEFSFGHITTSGVEHVSRFISSQPGITVGNYPLKQQRNFDRHTFEGELLPNWQVELYHNNVLIDFLASPVNGQYRFLDVPLLFGNNYFRLIFYGPLGEEREETHNFIVNGLLTKPGQQYYQMNYSDDEDSGKEQSSLQYDLGINKHLSLGFNYVTIPIDNTQHEYVKTTVSSFVESLFFNVNRIEDLSGGNVTEFGIQTKLSELNIKLNHSEYDDFVSEIFPSSNNPITARSSIKLDTVIPAGFLPRIPFSLEIDEDSFLLGNKRTTTVNRLSLQTGKYSLRNSLTQTSSTNQEDRTQGSFNLSRHHFGSSLRGTIDYELQPDSILHSVGVEYSGKKLGSYRLSLGFTHFNNNEQDFSIGLSKQRGDYSLSFDTLYNTNSRLSLNISASMSLGRNPSTAEWLYDSASIADKGAVSILVFLDKNNNGIRDKGEKGLRNIGFKLNGRRRSSKTDKKGQAFLPRVTADEALDISIASDSLEDPLWASTVKGIRIIPRVGQVTSLEFPIITTGEIDGTAYIVKNGKRRHVSDVEIQLVDQNGNVIRKEKSEYDGFYVISNILPGTYTLRVSPEQIKRLGLRLIEEKKITITSKSLVLDHVDLMLSRKQ